MQYIKEPERKDLFNKLQQSHGTITKLLDNLGQPLGYLIRCEKSTESEKPVVVVNVSFNKEYEHKNGFVKTFKQSDLKFFAMKKTLDFNVDSISKETTNFPFILKYESESSSLFDIGASAIVNSIMKKLEENDQPPYDLYDYEHENKIDLQGLKKYILSKIYSIISYYKGKEFTLLFI